MPVKKGSASLKRKCEFIGQLAKVKKQVTDKNSVLMNYEKETSELDSKITEQKNICV